eukprot:maker-scaffold18_size714446-snap-gene-3.25 protein:Tk08465 transcript:maker-scaffold18_size714446-snap-gene-3.25-mRNA-1 annotation:"hypothetical protein CGI_10008025"
MGEAGKKNKSVAIAMGLRRVFRRWRKLILTALALIMTVQLWLHFRSHRRGPPIHLHSMHQEISIFDQDRYEAVQDLYPIRDGDCKSVALGQVGYHLCLHDVSQDMYISGFIANGTLWEPKLSMHIGNLLSTYGPDALFLDIGANIGTHSLYVAQLGHQVVAVEPLAMNLVKLYRAAELDGTLEQIGMIENALDMYQHEAVIQLNMENIGGSYLSPQVRGLGQTNPNMVQVEAIRLQGIMDEIKNEGDRIRFDVTNPRVVVIKMDIEKYECRAFLGSREIFDMSEIFIPYILMEWRFADRTKGSIVVYPPSCPVDMVEDLIYLFDDR